MKSGGNLTSLCLPFSTYKPAGIDSYIKILMMIAVYDNQNGLEPTFSTSASSR